MLGLNTPGGEKVEIPILLEGQKALENIEDVSIILSRCGQKQLDPANIKSGDAVRINYSLQAVYYGNLPDTLARVKKLADKSGARAVVRVRMYLLEVLRALEAL